MEVEKPGSQNNVGDMLHARSHRLASDQVYYSL